MLDSGASNNIMPYGVMRQLGLKVTGPYQNVYAMDSKKVEVWGLIKDLKVRLAVFPERIICMDVVAAEVPKSQDMGHAFSRSWAATLGGTLQEDLSYATISVGPNQLVRINVNPK
jgi:hypothetical protein